MYNSRFLLKYLFPPKNPIFTERLFQQFFVRGKGSFRRPLSIQRPPFFEEWVLQGFSVLRKTKEKEFWFPTTVKAIVVVIPQNHRLPKNVIVNHVVRGYIGPHQPRPFRSLMEPPKDAVPLTRDSPVKPQP